MESAHKRPFSEMNEAAATAASAPTDAAQLARDALMHERRLLDSQLTQAASISWSSAAAQFAAAHLTEAAAVRDFRQLCDAIGGAAAAASVDAAAMRDEHKETVAPTLPAMQTAAVAVKPPILPVMLPVAAAASSSSAAAASPAASPQTPVASPASASPSAASEPVDLLASFNDISLLVPRGKYTLHLSSSGALFAQPPGPKSQSLSFPWSDVTAVIDVADVFKRDWYVVLTLRKGSKGMLVGKQTHHAVVIKMQATEKIKEGRGKAAAGPAAAKDPELRAVIARIQSLLDAQTSAHPAATLSSSLVSALREVPALSAVPFVAHDPSIFSSQKQLACVSCKLGVEDGALYFLRTGLLFLKPVMYLPLAELDGITPSRGAAGTFNMQVGSVGSARETAFAMIEPKEEAAITKYCQFLGAEQKRMEKAERRDKQAAADAAAGIVKAEPTSSAAAAASSSSSSAAAAVPSASSSSSAAAAAHSGATASDAIALDDDDMPDARPVAPSSEAVASVLSSAGLALSDILPAEPSGKRLQRRAKPTSFHGMDSDDEDKPSAAAAAAGGSAAAAKPAPAAAAAAASGKPAASGSDSDADDAEDAASVASSEQSDYSGGSGSESSDSAEYDSDKDAEEIASDAEGAGAGKDSSSKGPKAAGSSAEEESEEEQEEEEETAADAGMQDA